MKTIRTWRAFILTMVAIGPVFQAGAWSLWTSLMPSSSSLTRTKAAFSESIIVHEPVATAVQTALVSGQHDVSNYTMAPGHIEISENDSTLSDEFVSIKSENPIKNPAWTVSDDGKPNDPTFGIAAGVSATSLASMIQQSEASRTAGSAAVSHDVSGLSSLWGLGIFGIASRLREKAGCLIQKASSAASFAKQGAAIYKKLSCVAKLIDRASDFILNIDQKIVQYRGKIEVAKRLARIAATSGLAYGIYAGLGKLHQLSLENQLALVFLLY